MKGEWCFYKSIISPKMCSTILQEGLKIPPGVSYIGNNQVNDEYRRSKIRFITEDHSSLLFLFDEMWRLILPANDDWFNVHISKLDYIQLAEYDASYEGEYQEHHDVFWLNNDPKYHRKLTAVVQLTDPSEYEGGDLEITEANEKPDPNEIKQQGSVIIFPSMLRHLARPVTKGRRYSLACWFDGPKWR